jgi:hypothetical protein
MNKQELLRLKRAWVFDHANEMIEEFNMGRSEAFRQAYLVHDLLEALGQGEVTFRYEKKDGNDRLARGTRCRGISEQYDNYHYGDDPRKKKDKYLRLEQSYWDLDKQSFRSFSIASVKEIVSVVIK